MHDNIRELDQKDLHTASVNVGRVILEQSRFKSEQQDLAESKQLLTAWLTTGLAIFPRELQRCHNSMPLFV